MTEAYSPHDRKKGIKANCSCCNKELSVRFPVQPIPREFYEKLTEDQVLKLNDFGVTEYLSFVNDVAERMMLRFRIYYQKHNPVGNKWRTRQSVLIDFDKGKIKENTHLTPEEKTERKRQMERLRYRIKHKIPIGDLAIKICR